MKWSVLISILALGACSQEPPRSAKVSLRTAAPSVPVAAQASLAVITPEGWGTLRIGMSGVDLITAVGDNGGASEGPNACREFHPPRLPDGVFVMLQDGLLTRISVREPSTIQTDRGFGVGATVDSIVSAYGGAVQSEPHKYQAAPARYVTAWTRPRPAGETYVTHAGARGVRYEIGADGTVQWIRVGGPSIQLVESCS